MVRKRSCPAVSQICSLIRLPSRSMFLILKSMPIVVMKDFENDWLAYRRRRQVLPTPAGAQAGRFRGAGRCGAREGGGRRKGASFAGRGEGGRSRQPLHLVIREPRGASSPAAAELRGTDIPPSLRPSPRHPAWRPPLPRAPQPPVPRAARRCFFAASRRRRRAAAGKGRLRRGVTYRCRQSSAA